MDRRAALSLLERAVVLPRRVNDEKGPEKIVGATIALLLKQMRVGDPHAFQGIANLGSLPPRLLHEVSHHFDQVADAIGIESQTPVGRLRFAREPYFAAAHTALRTGNARVADVNGTDHELVALPAGDGGAPTLRIADAAGEIIDRDPRLRLVDPRIDAAGAVDAVERIDTGPAERTRLIGRLRGTDDRAEWVTIVDEHHRAGPFISYILLARALHENAAVTADSLMPWVIARQPGWLHADREDTGDLDAAAALLLRETDVATALYRNISLPRRLPEALVQAFRGESAVQQRSLLKNLWRTVRHGIGVAHLITLTWHALEGRSHRERTINHLSRRLAEVCAERSELHIRLTRWVSNELSRSPSAQMWPPDVFLAVAWSHSSEIFRILLEAGVREEAIAQLNDQLYPFEERLFGRGEIRDDCAHPGNVQPATYSLAVTNLIGQHGVHLSEKARVPLMSLILNFDDENRARGYDWALLQRNDLYNDALQSVFAQAWDEQCDANFAGMLLYSAREWRDRTASVPNSQWVRVAAGFGDGSVRDSEDLAAVLTAAAEIEATPINWASVNDQHRFTEVMFNLPHYPAELAESVRTAWSNEAAAVALLRDEGERDVAVEMLLRTAVELAGTVEVEQAVAAFAVRCAELRATVPGSARRVDEIIRRMYPRMNSAVARHLDKLLIAGRTT